MKEPTSRLEASWHKRTAEAQERVLKAIKEMQDKGEVVNFNTVHLKSGASKNYLYTNEMIRKEIENIRSTEAAKAGARHKKYERTSKSKDVLIEAKEQTYSKTGGRKPPTAKRTGQSSAVVIRAKVTSSSTVYSN